MDTLEQRTIAKVSARLIPFLILCFFVAYLDRVNVGFAALTMNADLGLSASAFGFGAGIFFLAYFLFEVPSNLFLERVGARKWIARIMFTWGLCSAATAFIRGETGFYVVRVLLGRDAAHAARGREPAGTVGDRIPRRRPFGLPRVDDRRPHGREASAPRQARHS